MPFRLFAGVVTSKSALLDDLAALEPCDLGVKNRVNFLGVIEGGLFSLELPLSVYWSVSADMCCGISSIASLIKAMLGKEEI